MKCLLCNDIFWYLFSQQAKSPDFELIKAILLQSPSKSGDFGEQGKCFMVYKVW